MPRFKLTIEYDGGPFAGWQRQADEPSVQQALEEAIFGFTGERVLVEGAGRTDAGVHATGQVAHIDISTERYDTFALPKAINAHLKPQPVAVVRAEVVGPDFHARFSAIERSYRYIIVNRRAPLTVEAGTMTSPPSGPHTARRNRR
jgi:tRNA pseudouridine38-40 synthase